MGKDATPPQGGRDDTKRGEDMNIYNLSIKGELSTHRLTAITPRSSLSHRPTHVSIAQCIEGNK